jgi:hypothetical protein
MVLDDEVEAGRLERDRWGRYVLIVAAFAPSTLRALVAMGDKQISVTPPLRRVVRQERSCAVCGETFTPPRCDGRYCSSACRQRAYRGRKVGAAT